MVLCGFLIISASLSVTLFMIAQEVCSSGDHVTSSCSKDGYGLNYTLPVQPCGKVELRNQIGSRLVQTIPKLMPRPRFMENACGRESRIEIPRGRRKCRVPDCDSSPCMSGWCEETMTSYECHCPPGITGRTCGEEKAIDRSAIPTTNSSIGVPTLTPTSTSAPTATEVTSSHEIRPLAFFKFENDVTDSSGFVSDSDVSVSGSLTYDVGICGQAASFDGNTNVNVHSFVGYPWGMNFSMSIWFKRRSNWYSHGIVNNGYQLNGSWKTFVFGSSDGGTSASALYVTQDEGDTSKRLDLRHNSIRMGTNWNHVVMTYDGNQLSAYLNGGSKRTEEGCCEIVTKQSPVTIGQAGLGSNAFYFDGLIDELRIYSHTLSEAQVRDLYNTSRCT